jgi:uncharacterized membrane protein YkvA (DUF1232 family)
MNDASHVTIELNPRELRFYDRLRSTVAERSAGEASGVWGLLLLLPDLAVLLIRLGRDSRVPLRVKVIAGLGLAYLLSPVDLLPSLLLGPIGLVDDLLVVGTALSHILNHVHPDIVRSQWSGQGDALEAIQRVTAWTERQVTGRIRSALNWALGTRS